MWAASLARDWQRQGLFAGIGLDYGFFLAVARAYLAGGAAGLYDQSRIAQAAAPLAAFYAQPAAAPLNVAPPVYPPAFFLLFVPLAALPPLAGWIAWTVANLLAALVAIRRLTRGSPLASWWWPAALLGFAPLATGLRYGQPSGLLLAALAEALLAFRAGRELRAGLCVGLLLLKPQYAVFLLAALVWQRRGLALAGAAAAGGAIALISLLLLGPAGIAPYAAALRDAAAFRPPPAAAAHAPGDMISWRGLLFNLWPAATAWQGEALSLALSAATAASLPLIWRGPWEPPAPAFARRLLATMLVTMLASFHNHLHGAALLLAPALLVARDGTTRLERGLLLAGLVVPAIAASVLNDAALASEIMAALILSLLLALSSPQH